MSKTAVTVFAGVLHAVTVLAAFAEAVCLIEG